MNTIILGIKRDEFYWRCVYFLRGGIFHRGTNFIDRGRFILTSGRMWGSIVKIIETLHVSLYNKIGKMKINAKTHNAEWPVGKFVCILEPRRGEASPPARDPRNFSICFSINRVVPTFFCVINYFRICKRSRIAFYNFYSTHNICHGCFFSFVKGGGVCVCVCIITKLYVFFSCIFGPWCIICKSPFNPKSTQYCIHIVSSIDASFSPFKSLTLIPVLLSGR